MVNGLVKLFHASLIFLIALLPVLLLFLRRATLVEADRTSHTLTPAIMCAVHVRLSNTSISHT
jgi:hypothetical protein